MNPARWSKAPSVSNRLIVAGLRAATKIAASCGIDVGTQLAPLIASGGPPTWATRGVEVTRTNTRDGWTVHEIAGRRRSGRYVIAIHGGAFVVQPTIMHWLDYAHMARRTGATVLVPMYPLAGQPGGNAATVIPAVADFITDSVSRHGTENVGVYGDSVGGTIALAAAQELVRRGDVAGAPSSLVLLSPALDVTFNNPGIAGVRDPVLSVPALKKTARRWADDLGVDDPSVSPINGTFEGLPPTAIYYGSLEILAPDVEKLQAMVSELGDGRRSFTFVLGEGRIHDWAQGGLPFNADARAAREGIFRLLGLLPAMSHPDSS